MQTLFAFVELVLGFVPFVAIVLATLTAVWAATKLFPAFGEWFEETTDGLFGVDAEYDEKYDTGYASTPTRW